jgi:AAA ATPase domain
MLDTTKPPFPNPFRPGAGHMPPYLAGREEERTEFERLLDQDPILQNLVLTGLRGVGKTVLLETFKPLAIQRGWLWVGTDLTEAASVTETSLAVRLLTDLSVVTSGMVVGTHQGVGFARPTEVRTMDYEFLASVFQATPGLVADKLKAVLELVASAMARDGRRGLVFAYDEAQNLVDQAEKNEFPLSLLLDVFQSIQRKGIPFLLALTGLPTLFPKLVEARTYSERMFRVVTLTKLSDDDSRLAILTPVARDPLCPVQFDEASVSTIVEESGGYPYLIQFMCREVFDVFIQQDASGEPMSVPLQSITRKLDTDFFAGRWAKATDRQRDLLLVIAKLERPADAEFTVSEIAEMSQAVLEKPFSASHVNQMLVALGDAGLVYKNRHGKYSFAVPLMDRFILRTMESPNVQLPLF